MDSPIDRAIAEFDSLSHMARELGITYQFIQDWRKKGRVPPEYCPAVERLTAGKIRCEELNDRVDWAYLRSTTTEHAAPA
jgi:DNA-binding transcriptional regulator YdaS (Cro superfamily)